MNLDGDRSPDTAGPQVVRLPHAGICRDDLQDLLLHVRRKRTLQQFVEPRANQVESHLEDKHRHDERCNRIGDAPLLAQEIGTGDTDQRTQRRQCVAAVMPGIGHDARTVDRAAFANGITVENFFGDDRQHGRHKGDQSRPGQQPAVDHDPDVPDAVDENPGPHDSQRKAYDDRGEGLVFAVAVIVTVVTGLGRNPNEGDHHDIGRKVRKRMHGIGNHRPASPDDSGGEFRKRQYEVDHKPDKGHAVDSALPDFRFTGHRRKS